MRKRLSGLFFLKILKIPISLILLSLTAKYFGVSVEKDIWLLTFATITTIDLAIWGPINETFRTKFVFVKEKEGEEKAIEKTQSLLTYFVVFSLIGVVLIILFRSFFSHIIAPDYNLEELLILQKMLVLVAPALLFNQLMNIGISILNAYEIFFVAEISSFVSNVLNIGLLILCVTQFGIYALGISYYISTILLIGFIIAFILKKKIPLFTRKWNFGFAGFKLFFLFAIPFFLPYFFGQINTLLEKIFAADLGKGFVSILDFSNRIPMLMYSIVISVVTTVVVPTLSKFFIRGEKKEFNSEFQKVFQLGIILIGLIVAFLAGASSSFVNILYNKGDITAEQLQLISALTVFYAASLIGLFSYILFGMSLLASENQKYYAIMGMLTQIFVVLLNFSLKSFVGVYIFPLSIGIVHLFFAWLMSRKFPFRKDLQLNVFKYISFVILLSVALFYINNYISFSNDIIQIIFVGLMLVITAALLSYLLKLEETRTLVSMIRKKK